MHCLRANAERLQGRRNTLTHGKRKTRKFTLTISLRFSQQSEVKARYNLQIGVF